MRRGVRLGGGRGGAAASVGDVDAADRRLLDGIDRELARVGELAGERLACRPGCDECCHGPFPITALDARRLERGLRELDRRDAPRAAAIRARARAVIETLREGFPGDHETGRPGGDVERLDAFFASHASLPCPVLDPASGRCELYDARPVACRLHGPPVRFAGGDAPPCHLCFVGETADRVEACRFDARDAGLERGALERLGVEDGREWETLIAWVVR